MKVTVFGSGYVGLVTGACFAEVGNQVLCIDIDEQKIEKLKQGIIPIYEPGLEPMIKRNFENGRILFSTDAKYGVEFGELQFIAVGTPPGEDGSADLSYVLAVAKTIAQYMQAHKIVIDKSTVPVGTADKVKQAMHQVLQDRGINLSFDVVSNPEFLKEGAAIQDFMKPDRVVIGTDSEYAKKRMHELYAPFNRNHNRLITMDVRSAELTKYAANAMLATKISFMNEMANLAEKLGADIEQVRQGIGSDPRIGFHFIYPGIGYGGSCFHPDELVFVDQGQGLECLSFKELYQNTYQGKKLKVLSGDMNGLCFQNIQCVTIRAYEDDLIELSFNLGKKLTVTKDHPVSVLKDNQLIVKLAEEITIGDQIILPLGQDNWLEREEHVFLDKSKYITGNYVVENNGTLCIQETSEISNTISQPVTLDENVARLIGYYLAIGESNKDYITWNFGIHEDEYIIDVKNILQNINIKFIEKISNNSHTIIVFSHLFAYLYNANHYQKTIPTQIFTATQNIQWQFLTGLLRGNSSITDLDIEYTTVSKKFAYSLIVLLQSLHIIASLKTTYHNKSTVETYILRINGLAPLFGKNWENYQEIAKQYQHNIKPTGYSKQDNFAVVTVKASQKIAYKGEVYSLESDNQHVITNTGLLVHNCFPKDVKALIATAQENQFEPQVLQAVESVNERQKSVLFRKIQNYFNNDLQGKVFAVWGLSFKPNTDDMREAPSRVIMEALWQHGAVVQAYDPVAQEEARHLYPDEKKLILCENAIKALEGAEALIINTEWIEFRSLNTEAIKEHLKNPVIFDGRNLYEPTLMQEYGITYHCIGRMTYKPVILK